MFILIDCDNFFVSCEKVFQPRLKNRPVVVLSNNDGCVVSRSYEAKALGIPMCSPYFKIEKFLTREGGIALSSNYELYADMSRRVMSLVGSFFPRMEVYSIDEAFAEIGNNENFEHIALVLRNTILRQTGISVSIGMAPTKTLCKTASELAKKEPLGKIKLLCDADEITGVLKRTDVSDVWGVGRRISKELNFMGIFTALELAQTPQQILRHRFNILLAKTARELQGISCIGTEEAALAKTLICSRSFENEISSLAELEIAIAEFTGHACRRLREQKGMAGGIMTSISTNRFKDRQYSNSRIVSLGEASCHTSKFIKAAREGLRSIYRPGFGYKKAGVMLLDITPQDTPQRDFFEDRSTIRKELRLMQAFDDLNRRLGRKTVYFGAQAAGIKHYIKREFKSSSYTTSWDGLPSVS